MKCKMIKKLTAIGLAFITVFTFIPAFGEGGSHIGMETVYAVENENLAINFPFFVGDDDIPFNDTIYTDGTRDLQYIIDEPDMDNDSISFSIGIWNEETDDWDILLEEGDCFSVNRQEKYATFDGEKIASVIGLEEESVTLDVLMRILDKNKKEHTKWLTLDLDKPIDNCKQLNESTTRLLGEKCSVNRVIDLRYIRNNSVPEGKHLRYEITDYSIEQIPSEGNEGDVVEVSEEGDDTWGTIEFNPIGVGKAIVSLTYTCTDDTYYKGEEIKSVYEITVISQKYRLNIWAEEYVDELYAGEREVLRAEGSVYYGTGRVTTEGFSYQWSLDTQAERYLSLTVDPDDSSKAVVTYDKEPDSELTPGESRDCDAYLTVRLLHHNEVVEEHTIMKKFCRLPIISVRKAELIIDGAPFEYTAEQIRPPVHVVYNGMTLQEGEDYEVWYAENINTGSGCVCIKGRGDYAADVEQFFEIVSGPNSPAGRWSAYKGIPWWVDQGGNPVPHVWRQNNGEWYYTDSEGFVLKNGWAKDSKGWCWLGNDGKITKSKWILYKDEWYYLKSDGYMATNKWVKDSRDWCYLGANGKMVKKRWAKDSKGWCWLGSDGYCIKNKWIKSAGYWYYLKSNGYMATGTLKIGGKTYKFDSSGRWIL